MQILTNHIGYEANGHKLAIIMGNQNDRCETIRLIDLASDKEALFREPVVVGAVPGWKDWFFWTADFTSITQKGTYRLECVTSTGTITSAPFLIQALVLERQALSNVVAYFKSMRCSGSFDRADHRMTFEGDPSIKPVDVHGGWYDATADYGKHLSHLCFSTYFNPQQLPMVAWSLFQSMRELRRKSDPNFRQLLRRMQDEALFGADYLVRIHKPGGSFYITVSGFGPEKRPADRRLSPAMRGFRLADPEKKDAYAPTAKANPESRYESSFRSGAGVSIAALAAAAACGERCDFTSQVYLETAEDAFVFLEAHNPELTNDGKENILDDYCALLAAVELYKASHKELYRAAASRRAVSLMYRLVTSDGYAYFWRADDQTRPFFHAADAGLPLLSLLAYLEIAPDSEKPHLMEAIQRSLRFELALTAERINPFGYARQLVQNKAGEKRTAFFFPHDTETAPWWQGENARLASLAAAARLASPYFNNDQPFYDQLQAYAQHQLDWILGLNPYDACMLHGSGRNNPPYLFFNSWEYLNLPGGICNGITGSFSDENSLGTEGIDFQVPQTQTGQDSDWRWTEQWLPHAAWFLLAVSAG
jgi:hypothetical protein